MSQNVNRYRLLDLLEGVAGSWWTVVAGVCLGLSAAAIVLQFTSPIYEVKTKVSFGEEGIPEEFIRSTVQEGDARVQLATLREAVLAESNLRMLVSERLGLADEPEEQNGLLVKIQSGVQVILLRGSEFFEIRYRDSNPQRAADVVNGLTDLLVEENSRQRSARAGEATKTFETLAAETRQELEARERAIAEFRSRHPYETSDQLALNLRLLEDRQTELEENRENQTAAQTQLRGLRAVQSQEPLLDAVVARTEPAAPSTGENAPPSSVRQLREELKEMLSRLTEKHPDVVAKQREIEAALREAESRPEPSGPSPQAPPVMTNTTIQILEVEQELQKLRKEEKRIQGDIARYEARIRATPLIQQELDKLTNGVVALRATYDNYLRMIETAKASERVQEGTRFTVVEWANAPGKPIWPQTPQLAGIGAVGGLVLLVGPLVLRLLLQPAIGSEATARELLTEVPVLVSIPRIETSGMLRLKRRRRLKNVLLSFLSVLILAAVVIALTWPWV